VSNPVEHNPRRDPFTAVLLGACLVLSALVVLLAWQNWTLKRRVAELQATAAPQGLAPGDRVAPFDVLDATGATRRVDFGDGFPRTLLLVFSSTCPACESNMPIWRELLSRPLSPSLRVVGIQTDAKEQASPDPALPFAVFRVDRSRRAPLDRIPYVPTTIVLDPRGQVIAAWSGVLGERERSEVARQLEAPATSG
jgi:peroxiredoxin